MANLAAAMLWQLAVGLHPLINLLALDARSFRDYASADALVDGISEDQVVEVKERLARRRAGANWAATPDLLESAWCKGWRLDPSSLRICLRLAEDLEETVQRQCPALQQAGYGKSPWWISGGALQYPDVALAGPLTSIDDLCGAETASALGNIIKSALRALTVPGDEPCPQAVDPLAYLSPPRPT